MNEHEKNNIEELLSSYIDGELSERQCNEVKRLVNHNEQAAAMLKQLQKNKELLGSLPRAQAPAHLFENVRASLERSVLLDEYHGKAGARAGAVHLFARRMVAAAAMIALVGALGAVIYNIIKPVPSRPAQVAKSVEALPKMQLQLQTAQATAVNQFIYRNVILDNGLQASTTITQDADKKVYAISCSRARAQMAIEGLGMIWDKFKAAQLSVEGSDEPIANVTAEQAIEIANQTSAKARIQLAKDFKAANKERLEKPDSAIVAADSNNVPAVIKPTLASGAAKTSPNEPADTQKISLTIIVTGS